MGIQSWVDYLAPELIFDIIDVFSEIHNRNEKILPGFLSPGLLI
jgi:hypothetical protein